MSVNTATATPANATNPDDLTIARIKRNIANPPMQSRVIEFTPGVALWVLENLNIHNRPKKAGNIVRYAGDMKASAWGLTGDTIKFSDKGLLRDGQNRLAACVRAGVPFTTHVVFGIEDALFDRMDRGKNRDGGDVLSIVRKLNARVLSQGIRWGHLLITSPKSRKTLEPRRILDYAEGAFKDMENHTTQARIIAKGTGQPAGLVTAILFLTASVKPREAQAFAAAWENGNYRGRFRPLSLLDRRLRELGQMSSGRVHDTVRAALIVMAWNLYIHDRVGNYKDFTWNPAQDFPDFAFVGDQWKAVDDDADLSNLSDDE